MLDKQWWLGRLIAMATLPIWARTSIENPCAYSTALSKLFARIGTAPPPALLDEANRRDAPALIR